MRSASTKRYLSRRQPILARNVVATSQPLAAQAGLGIMARGGNAVDAALGSAIALTVVEPTSNGVGGDGFAQVWDGSALHGFNGSGRSPDAWTPDRFKGLENMPDLGWDAVTVPGAVDLWVQLSERFGRIDFEALFEPAVRYAREGFLVGPVTAAAWQEAARKLQHQPGFAQTFLPGGRAPRVGEMFRNPGLAISLEEIASTRGESFYRGGIAARIVAHSRAHGGVMSEHDLGDHRGIFVEPVSVDYRGYRVHELPPNGQGLAALIALGVLARFELSSREVDGPDSLHLQIEAMRCGFDVAARHVSDPETMTCDVADYLAEGFLADLASGIRLDGATALGPMSSRERGTVYLAAADADGRMVSLIQSNFHAFGSGVVVDESGISLHNRGSGFVLEAGHPNQVGPRKRPFHTIIPGFLTRQGKPALAFGVMGAHMQPQGHVQVLSRMLDHDQGPQAALDAPRWRLTVTGELALEDGVEPETRRALRNRGHPVVEGDPGLVFGAGQLVWRLDDGYCSASDPRKEGQAVGF